MFYWVLRETVKKKKKKIRCKGMKMEVMLIIRVLNNYMVFSISIAINKRKRK